MSNDPQKTHTVDGHGAKDAKPASGSTPAQPSQPATEKHEVDGPKPKGT